jgi:predicted Fe-Mo cluster-binding NifX family protein
MTATVCVPLNTDGTLTPRLGQAPRVAVCRVDAGAVSDWTEHAVAWDTTYGVDVLGVHHPRVVRFLRDQQVDTVVAADVCESMQQVLGSIGVTVRTGYAGDARTAVQAAMEAATVAP